MLADLFSRNPLSGLIHAPKPQHILDLVRVEEAAELPLAREELKAHLRVDCDDDDALIDGLIAAVVDDLDGYSGILGRCIVQQAWAWSLDHGFPCHRITIPLPPLRSVVSIEYVDSDGVAQTLDPSAYVVLDGPRSAIEPAPGTWWPATRRQSRAVVITFKAGLAETAADVPPALKAALKLAAGDLYENREAVIIDPSRVSTIENPTAVRLIAKYIVRR
jgi:uncharacterized phiE125 gp8 family phage protein